jgi:VCBS repeat-containing protein
MNRRLNSRNISSSALKRRLHLGGQRLLRAELLEARELLAADVWHNALLPYDVNGDSFVTSLDALIPINELNRVGAGPMTSFAGRGMLDVNHDGMLTSLDPLLVINELNRAEGEGEVVQLRLEVVSATTGDPLTSVQLNEAFELRGYVQDLRGLATGGVFAAYMDVTYDPTLVEVTGAITHAPLYQNGRSGSTATAGLVDEVGSFDGLTALGPDEQLLFSIPMQAGTVSGTVNFLGDPADIRPAHDVLLYGEVTAVPSTEILFTNTTLTVGDGGSVTPVTEVDSYDGTEDTLLNVTAAEGVLANDTVAGGGALTASVAVGPSAGSLTLNADGSFSYLPDPDFNGVDSFTYIATSGTASAAPTLVTLNIAPVNDAPRVTGETYSVTGNEVFIVTAEQGVLMNDFDVEGSPLTAREIQGPAHGSLVLVPSGAFAYNPEPGFTGTDSFTYVANDGELDSETATATLIVTRENGAPVAVDDSYAVGEDNTLAVAAAMGVLENDTDPDGDPLQASAVTQPSHGELTLNADGSFDYVPAANYHGSDSFTYRVSDGELTSNTATVTITINPVNDAPVARNDSYGVTFETTLAVSAAEGVLANDTDIEGDALTAILDTAPVNGELTLNPNGSFSYTPAAGFTGSDSFTYMASDGQADSNLATVTLVVAPSGPQVTFRLQTTDLTGTPISEIAVGSSFLLEVFVQDTSPERNGVFAAYLDISYQTALAAVNGNLIFTETYPNGLSGITSVGGLIDEAGAFDGFNRLGGDELLLLTVPLRARDGGVVTFVGSPADTSPNHDVLLFDDTVPIPVDSIDYGSVSLTITGEAVPVAIDDEYAVANNTTLVVNAEDGVFANDIGVIDAGLTASLVTGPAHGTLQLNLDGSFTYSPDATFAGADTFTYRGIGVADATNTATVTINVGNLSPGSVSGSVYVDADNDGVRDPMELAFGGVRVELLGTDLFGDPVSRSTTTARDGSYFFGNLLAGNYVVREAASPLLVIDGHDTHDGTTSAINDAFAFDLASGEVATGLHFGERGLRPEFIGNPFFFSSARREGVSAAISTEGDQSWYCIDRGWDDMLSVHLALSEDASTVEITAVDRAGNSYLGHATTANPNVRVTGNAASGYLVRVIGAASEYSLEQVAISEAAVDRVFAEA